MPRLARLLPVAIGFAAVLMSAWLYPGSFVSLNFYPVAGLAIVVAAFASVALYWGSLRGEILIARALQFALLYLFFGCAVVAISIQVWGK